jgi:transcriptional regulator PpsR
VTSRAPEPADLGALSGCAAELAEAFVSLASDIALVIDDQGVVQSVTQSSSAPIAADGQRWVGRPWADMMTGDTRRKVELMLSDLRSTGVARRREVNVALTPVDGVPVAFSALRLGRDGPLLAVGRDLRAVAAIQQRFLDAQQELERGYWRSRQAESRYRLLFQVATDAVLTLDAHSLRIIEANHAAAHLLGAGLPLAGRPATDLVDRSSAGALRELLQNTVADGKPAEIPVRLPKAPAAAAVSATPFRAGGGLRLLLRVRAGMPSQAQAAEMNKTLALLVDSTRDGVVVTDSAGAILVANPAFLALVLGASEDDVRGRPIGDWLGRIDADVATLLDGAHTHGIAHLVRSSLRRADGQAIDVDVTGAMLAEGEQECFGFTIRPCEPRAYAAGAWARSLGALDDGVGRLPLSDLMARSQRLVAQHFIGLAMQRSHGNATAAARLLGIAVEQLLQALADEPAADT